VAYLNTLYPAISHTFIEREIQGLRNLGWEIHPISVRRAAAHDLLGKENQSASRETFVLLDGIGSLLIAQVVAFGLNPVRYLRAFFFAVYYAKGLRRLPWFFAYLFEAARLSNTMRHRGLSHVHVHMANNGAWVALLAAEMNPRIFYSLSIHGPTEFTEAVALGLAEKIKKARFIRCISEFCRSQVMVYCNPRDWPKLRVIHCGIDLTAFPLRSVPSEKSVPKFLAVGRLVPEKGFSLLLQALSRLKRLGHPFTFRLIGDGPERARLEKSVGELGLENEVQFAGALSPAEVKDALDQNEIFVLPSFMEGVPVVLMESMAKGLITVSTRIAGIPELITDGATGYLVTAGSVPDLERVLLHILAEVWRSPELRSELRKGARAQIENDFNLQKVSQDLSELFSEAPGALQSP
jgi:glycosyltransferase involved in cell wall biosynthesis